MMGTEPDESGLTYLTHLSSCGAASRVKPKVRLCEPWVRTIYVGRAPKGRLRLPVINIYSLSPLRGSQQITDHYPRLAKVIAYLANQYAFHAPFSLWEKGWGCGPSGAIQSNRLREMNSRERIHLSQHRKEESWLDHQALTRPSPKGRGQSDID